MQQLNGFRVVITGKGGVGKTTLTSCLSRLLGQRGIKVLAADEDPQMNLPYALGMPPQQAAAIVPLSQNPDYIEEKTGARPGKSFGALFRLNPVVDDVVERFGVRIDDHLDLLVMGTVVQAAAGCLCSENVLLDSVLNYLALRNEEAILLDTQAGVEHFGRALAKGFSQCLVVSDLSFNALAVARHAAELARQLGIARIHLVVNRYRDEAKDKLQRFAEATGTDTAQLFDVIHTLPGEPRFEELEPDVTRILGQDSAYVTGLQALADDMVAFEKQRQEQSVTASVSEESAT
ncbi:carbon monoxide dehydrogenase accessory protein CooC [Syntrophotalea carbinolica DSM 2380]|uniref:Carbon monoxide dehydrogenase accessory protein CooC n=1 Tax=Syntrophotalea carbinolica (strain DSM 2380 / NBRC 103641 / GraBd1) TaxID=338963 RepID=Q3A8H1_SYNC1|nr:AAA family ATPase [Syntrophotalea carbinolica]ABA87321.1 carbon monoxide dehydrogenase accessory protein CooC [Syntrophotalea carbinolica DSM 2380]